MSPGWVHVARLAVVPTAALGVVLLVLALVLHRRRKVLLGLAGIALAVAVLAYGVYLPSSA